MMARTGRREETVIKDLEIAIASYKVKDGRGPRKRQRKNLPLDAVGHVFYWNLLE